jgi:hypothetical protein
MMHQQQPMSGNTSAMNNMQMQGQGQQQQPFSGGSPNQVLQGAVFERLQRFHALPAELQHDVTQFQAFVEQNKQLLFKNNTHALIKSVYGVKGKRLVKTIMKWLTGPNVHSSTQQGAQQGTQGTTHVNSELLIRAKQIAEALVLAGFITPYNESITDLKNLDPTAPAHYVHDHELLIPVGKNVAQLNTTSVWSVADGAIYARFLKRKAGLMGQITDGKDVYVVMNQRNNVAYLFESDVAREPISEIRGDSVSVQADSEHFDFGVRVAQNSGYGRDKPELFNAGSKHVQDELINAWLSIGAQPREHHMKQMLHHDAREGGHHEVRDADIAAAGMNRNQGGAAGSQNFQGQNQQQQQFGGQQGQVPYGGTDPSQQQGLNQNFGAQQGQSYGGGDMQPGHHHHHNPLGGERSDQAMYGGDAGQFQQREGQHHHMGGQQQQDLSREIPYGGGAQYQQQNFGAQGGPSLAAPYGNQQQQQSKHHQQGQQYGGQQQDPARERQIADAAAAQVAGIGSTRDQYSAAGGNQGSAPPSKYQEYTTGVHDAPVQP